MNMNSGSRDADSDRALLRLLNPNRAACEERILREHMDAVRNDIARLPIMQEAVHPLEQQFDSIASMLSMEPIRDAVREFALLKGEDVLFTMTYRELDQLEPRVLHCHRMSITYTLLEGWKKRSIRDGHDDLAEYLESALSEFASSQPYWS